MLVTFEVSSLLMSSAFSDVHPSNMLAMLVARDVSRPDKSTAVSYTHLDVYKRQMYTFSTPSSERVVAASLERPWRSVSTIGALRAPARPVALMASAKSSSLASIAHVLSLNALDAIIDAV